LKTP
jgi:hypothetical protein